jgi:hypothetical protein
MYHGKKVSFSAFGKITQNNLYAQQYYLQAFTYRTAGNVALIVGGAAFFIGSIISIGFAHENQKLINALAGVYIGLPIMALSIPFHLVAKRNIEKTIDVYNQDLQQTAFLKI